MKIIIGILALFLLASSSIYAKTCPSQLSGLTFHIAWAEMPSKTVHCVYKNETDPPKTITVTSNSSSDTFTSPWHKEDKNIYCDVSSAACSFP